MPQQCNMRPDYITVLYLPMSGIVCKFTCNVMTFSMYSKTDSGHLWYCNCLLLAVIYPLTLMSAWTCLGILLRIGEYKSCAALQGITFSFTA